MITVLMIATPNTVAPQATPMPMQAKKERHVARVPDGRSETHDGQGSQDAQPRAKLSPIAIMIKQTTMLEITMV